MEAPLHGRPATPPTCAGDEKPAKGLWNGWLEERERAPGDVLVEWLREKTQGGFGQALEAARAALPTLAEVLPVDMLPGGCGGPQPPSPPARIPSAPSKAEAAEVEGEAEAEGKAEEALVRQLFELQDLDGDSLIQEEELIRLTEQVARLHGNPDGAAVRERCREVFRRKLDPDGRPVAFPAFRQHMFLMLSELVPKQDQPGRLSMLRQFVAEAEAGRAALREEARAEADSKAEAGSARATKATTLAVEAAPSQAAARASSRGLDAPATILPAAKPGSAQVLSFADRVQSISAQTEASLQASPQASLPAPDTGKAAASGGEGNIKADQEALAEARELVHKDQGAHASQVDTLDSPHGGIQGKRTAESKLESLQRPDSFDSVGSFVPAPTAEDSEGSGAFSKGEPLQIWSNSKGLWLDGFVEEHWTTDCEAEGYSIPAGTLKVRSSAGVKWIMAGQAEGVLRKRPVLG